MKKLYFLFFTFLITAVSFGQTTVFINEIHYDNSGADTDEGVEIAGPAGTDLSTYTINLYNGGGNPAGESYDTTTLTGTIPDEGAGFGAVWFPISGIQNGGPDGISLDNNGTLIQFLSYEGAFTASGGPADGLMSTDISVSETSGTPAGQSLQLIGSGTDFENFTWSVPSTASAGTINSGQTFGAATPNITIIGTVGSLDYFENNGPSMPQSFDVNGANLTQNITINAPMNFEVSDMPMGTYSSSLMVTQNSGSASATVYVRLSANLTANTYNGDLVAMSSGAPDAVLTLEGVVSPANPEFTVFGTVNPLNYIENNGPSEEDSFSVEGLFLTNNITVTAPTNFEISLMSGGTFSSSVMITPDGSGTVPNTDIFVRLAAMAPVGSYSGDITISSSPVADETVALTGSVFGPPSNSLALTAIFDGPVNSNPKGVELTALEDIADLSLYGLGSANNGGGTDGQEFTFPSVSLTRGDVIYVASESTDFMSFFGFAPDYTSGAMGINGDDAIELFENGTVIDTYGVPTVNGDGEAWDYTDGWAYRVDATGPDASWIEGNWTYSGINALDNETSNATAANPIPIASFVLSNNNFETREFSIFPNPTNTGEVTISSVNAADMSVTVFDMLGKQVKNQTISNNRLDVSNLKSGIYLLNITQNGATSTKKLVIR